MNLKINKKNFKKQTKMNVLLLFLVFKFLFLNKIILICILKLILISTNMCSSHP